MTTTDDDPIFYHPGELFGVRGVRNDRYPSGVVAVVSAKTYDGDRLVGEHDILTISVDGVADLAFRLTEAHKELVRYCLAQDTSN